MPRFAVEVHPPAADEAEAAERWYRDLNEDASTRFRRELDRVVEAIAEQPESGSLYLNSEASSVAPLSLLRGLPRARRTS